MRWVAWGVTTLSAGSTESLLTSAKAVPGIPARGRITTLAPPDSVPGLAVLSVFLVVSLGLLRYRWTTSRDDSSETDERGSATVGTDGESGPADEASGRDGPVAEHETPASERDSPAVGDAPGYTSGIGAAAATPKRTVDEGVDDDSPVPAGDGVTTSETSPPPDESMDPASTDLAGPSRPTDGGLAPPKTDDETRVLGMLETNDGSMKQARIVEETDWSKSKVSTLLSEMADDGTITKLRLGRKNVIFLDGEEPEIALSQSGDERGPP